MRLAPYLLPAALVLPACGASAPRTTTPSTTTTPTGGDRIAPSEPGGTPLVRAVEPTPMPTCEAGDLNGLASLADGIAAQPAIASHANGALVAFITIPTGHASRELTVAIVDAQGALHGSTTRVDTGPNPSHPALAALGDGYVLAWREGQPGQERIVARRIAADGSAQSTAVNTDGIGSGWLGAPAVATRGETIAFAVARSTNRPVDLERRRADHIDWSAGSIHGVANAPAGGAFEATRAPQIVFAGERPHLFATVMPADAQPGVSRALVEISLDANAHDHMTGVLEQASSARIFATAEGALLATWRAPVTAHDVAIRTWALDGSAPPLTVATFRGAHDAEASLVPLGEHLYGVFTLSALADDDGGTLNVSVVTDRAQPVGRQPLLVSSLVRSAAVVSASTSDRHLFVIEGHDDNGHGVLGIAPVQCSVANHADPLQVPPAGLVQRLGSLDEPSAQLAHPTGTCSVALAPQTALVHQAASGDIVAESDARIVSLGNAGVVFGVTREQERGATHLVVRGLDARGTLSAPASSLEGAKRIVAAGRSGASAVALVAHGGDATHPTNLSVVAAGANGRASAPVAIPLVDATSAAIGEDGRALYIAASSDRTRGDHGLFRVPLANGRPGAPALVVPLAPGDEVFDVMRSGRDTLALLARPDELGAAVSRELTVATIPDAAPRQPSALDPFADPRAHGRGAAWFARGASGPVVVYAEGNLVRSANLEHSSIRHPHSTFGTHDGGGALVARERANDATWLAVASGLPSDAAHVIAPVSLVALSPRGEVRIAASDVAANDRMIAGRASIARIGDRIAVIYAQPAGDTAANWRLVEVTCREGSAPPLASSSPPPASSAPAAPASNGGH